MAKARRLDRKRPFAEIFGNHAAKYEQFGIHFDADEGELPGYEHVVIPEDKTVIISTGDEEALRQRITLLEQENSRLCGLLEDQEAMTEEAQGRADTLQIEVNRLREQQANAPAAPADSAPKNGKAKGPAADQSSIDAQLKLQDEA